jgi:hypothetical protein
LERWNVRPVFEAFTPTVGTEGSEHVELWDQIRKRLFRWHGCRGPRVSRFKDEECLDGPSEEGRFTTRANASEAMHSSYLSGLGGEKNADGDHNGCFDDGGGDAQPDGGGKGKEGNAGKEVGPPDLGGQREAEAGLQKEGGEFERGLGRREGFE